MKIIYIAGIDGSGKTTLAKNLEAALQGADGQVRYFYARHFAVLLFPFRILARMIALRGMNEFGDYRKYIAKKKERSKKHKLLSRVYAMIWFFDYWLVTQIRCVRHRFTGGTLIADRYFYDVAMTISISIDLTLEQFYRLVKFSSRFFVEPSISFFLDLPEPTAYSRKNDIQSIQYLTERRLRYLGLSGIYGWHKVDATMSPADVLNNVLDTLKPNKTQS
jgi:thymidylate kinase